MVTRINMALLCVVIVLQMIDVIAHYNVASRNLGVGRFQWMDTPGKQLGFDTKTGKRCWVWADAKVQPGDEIQLCSTLAKEQ